VAKIRERLADPASAKGASTDDFAALQEFYSERTEPPVWTTDTGLNAKAEAAIKEIKDAGRWGLDARAFDPPSAQAQSASVDEQAEAEVALGLAILKYARYARGGRLQPSRVNRLFDQKPPVRAPKAVLTEIAAADAPDAYLRAQHPKHPQFQKLREALSNARGNERQVQQITANMERWRWMPAELGAFHIWNNVPEFNTRVVKGGKTVYAAKTIVGELRYATPFFSAPMSSVVFHPEWNVPETILREDIQPALQQRGFRGPNVAILQQHNLRVSFKGQPIDPRAVDWNAVNIRQYRFTQPPGPANVLGKFKFNFPNRHAVYMHDTPQRHLFAKQVRTLSHGCIRVNEPERLAALLLAEDKGWSPQKVRSMLGGGNAVVPLKRHIPVHQTYFTLVVDESGRLQTFPDYYGLDGPTARALFGNAAVKFQGAPAAPAGQVVSEAPPRQQQQRQQRAGRIGGPGSIGGVISGLFGN
jgi:murein L,D-transpeptidase YcbB/YkuD